MKTASGCGFSFHFGISRVSALLAWALCFSGFAAERLDRGVVALPQGDGKVYVGWRLLASDPPKVAFDVYRSDTVDGRRQKLTEQLISDINRTLKAVAAAPSYVDALYAGLLGNKEDGVYPGRAGKNSVITTTPTKGNGRLRLNSAEVRKRPVRAAKSSRPAAMLSRR